MSPIFIFLTFNIIHTKGPSYYQDFLDSAIRALGLKQQQT